MDSKGQRGSMYLGGGNVRVAMARGQQVSNGGKDGANIHSWWLVVLAHCHVCERDKLEAVV
jgi:hypothetical protein